MGFLAALCFLTILPLRQRATQSELGRSLSYFPLVGLLIGGILLGLDWALGLIFPPSLTSAMVVIALVALTGALHLDGLADTCDGIAMGKTSEERLRIMRDSRIGSFGTVGLFSVLLIKFLALTQLSGWDRLCALLLMPTMGRWAMAFSVFAHPYARPSGMGKVFKEGASLGRILTATAAALTVCLVLIGLGGLMLMVGVWLIALALGRFFRSRLGGFTGDAYGAINEIGEALTLLLLLTFVKILPWGGLFS